MRLVIQRVKKAKVSLEKTKEVAGEIGKGLFVLVGFKKGDSEETVDVLAQKLLKLRVMSDREDKMNLTVSDVGGSFLIVSQFTLYADTSGGNRPSFIEAGDPTKACELYDYFVEQLRSSGAKVETGKFGEYMKIDVSLDGPVTILMEN